MKKIASRSIAALALVAILIAGLAVYIFRLASDGEQWVTFAVNHHAYSNGLLKLGTVYDRNGRFLTSAEDGYRVYSDDWTTRHAMLHVVGDTEGNIGTGALSYFAKDLMGYSFVNGVFSPDGAGDEMFLTCDAYISSVALNALGYFRGAVAVYNYKTGETLCLVSSPGFDPADPPVIEDGDERYDGAYINRCLSSTFTPGSTFKLVTLAAAIENIPDLFEREFYCGGEVEIGDEIITCSGNHGTIGIEDALAHSCNCAFGELAVELGAETLEKYSQKLGLLDSFKVSGIPVAAGSYDKTDDLNDLAWSGIGQYNDLVNPVAMMRLCGAVANGGRAVNPRVIISVKDSLGIPAGIYNLRSYDRLLSESTSGILAELMRNDVISYYGDERFPGLTVCAKSGTAEVAEGDAPHAWFVGFLDDPENPLAFAVFVENGGWGVSVAGEVANQVLQAAVE